MAQSHQTIEKIVADTCIACKIDMIGDVPTMPVSGDIGNGFFCTPSSVNDLAFLGATAEPARPTILSGALRIAMQKAQAALKAADKKNGKLTDEERFAVAQTAFAGALNGSVTSQYNESSALRGEATRMFVANKVLPWAKSQDKDTSDSALEQYRAAIEKDNAAAYPGWIETLMAEVAKSRTYAVSRKGAVDGVKIETAGFDPSKF